MIELARTEKSHRIYARGVLLRALEQKCLLRRVVVGASGCFVCQTQDWDSYWQPVLQLGIPELTEGVERLQIVWRHYVGSEFPCGLRHEYCFRYFQLLDKTLTAVEENPSCAVTKRALPSVLAFECFGIEAAGLSDGPLAAATTTLRNPAYLLTKLKIPAGLDDPRFLPLVTLPDSERPAQFYHYRQHRLSIDSANALLLYLPTSVAKRREGFRIVSQLERRIAERVDPRANERAKRLAESVIMPYVRAALRARNDVGESPIAIELLDLGAGTGLLASKICQCLRRALAVRGVTSRFGLRLVDPVVSDPSHIFPETARKYVGDGILFVGDDYQRWSSNSHGLRNTGGIRIGLVSQLFNNLSAFAIRPAALNDLSRFNWVAPSESEWQDSLPSRCLADGGSGPDALIVSNSPIWLETGRTFAQISLSQYFRGLHFLSCSRHNRTCDSEDSGTVFLPVRGFRPQCLLADDGSSVLGNMLRHCSIVVVHDADLRPEDLKAHREQTATLIDSKALDMAKSLGLRGNYCYVLLRADDAGIKALKGERLW